MNYPETEVEPDFFLQVNIPQPISVEQVAVLRKATPGGMSDIPANRFLIQLRAKQRITLGPYGRKYLVERAKSELEQAGLTVKVQIK
jgi:hypothetical protein